MTDRHLEKPLKVRLGPYRSAFDERLAAEGGSQHGLLRRLAVWALEHMPKEKQ